MRYRETVVLLSLTVLSFACGDGGDDGDPMSNEAGAGSGPQAGTASSVGRDGTLDVLTYNVAGLPEGLSSSNPSVNTPLISPKLNAYDLALVQEDWLTPDPNPLEGVTEVYHELLAAEAEHPHQSEPAPIPFGMDPARPTALLSDGLNRFSNSPFGVLTRVAWADCFGGLDPSDGGASDCLAFKGFSVATHQLADGVDVDVYNLHGEAGSTETDQMLSEADFVQLADFILEHSDGRAILLGGDTNLHTDEADDAAIWETFQQATGLLDVCDMLDDCETSIDKIALRSNDAVALEALSHELPRAEFTRDDGESLSDHAPTAVQVRWSTSP
jgi:hypothetical protein